MKVMVGAAVLAAAGVALALPVTSREDRQVTQYMGACDASAAVAVGETMFVVANDEDNILRVYRRNQGGAPVRTFDLTAFLAPDPEHPEADIEGATRIGDRVYWITSHGRNRNARLRTSRHRLFATDVTTSGGEVMLNAVGTPYANLLKDLVAAPELAEFRLDEAEKRAPEQTGGLNIEGLTATPEGTLLIAFRNPVPAGKALLVPLENPAEVVAGRAARLGRPVLLSLGGLGVRSIEYVEARRKYLIVAGPPADEGEFKLYEWSGDPSEKPELHTRTRLSGINPEALIVYPRSDETVQLLSDDGAEVINGVACKDASPERRSFRSISLTP